MADSTSVNLFKLLAGALRLRPGRRVILSEAENFPTDLYVAQGLASLVEGAELRVVPRADLAGSLDGDVAVLMLTHVDFRTGALHDVRDDARRPRRGGARALRPLAQRRRGSGRPRGCGADLAVGCGYKYLNGGPGAPAFAFVARRHHEAFASPLAGWMGHAEPFAFETGYRPAAGHRARCCAERRPS